MSEKAARGEGSPGLEMYQQKESGLFIFSFILLFIFFDLQFDSLMFLLCLFKICVISY